MGANNNKENHPYKLPPQVMDRVMKLFELIDTDKSKTIDRQETLKFWSRNFAKLNTNELFDQVDKNNDGRIQLDEWLEFWSIVMKSGYTEEEISTELDNMIAGGSWVKFETTEKMGKRKEGKIKKEGKY